jgi:hypothetical protein
LGIDKMEFRAVCTWGDGPDVLLKIDANMFDLTASDAKKLANELLVAAHNAEEIEQVAKNADAHTTRS